MTKLGFALLFTTATFVSGCMVGPDSPTESDDPTDEDLPPEGSEAALSNNARTAFNYFVNKGFTEIQSAGIVGNLMQESSVRPTAVQYGGGPGRGIAQWSIGERWNGSAINLVSFASARGLNRWNLSTQLDFIWHELTNVPAYGLAQLRAATTVSQATSVFQSKYEICGTCSSSKRQQYALQAYNDYGGSSGSGGSTGDDGGDDTSDVPAMTCYSGTLDREMVENACVQSVFDGLWYQCSYGQWVDRWSDPDPCVGEYPL